jgi:hypothetical protein
MNLTPAPKIPSNFDDEPIKPMKNLNAFESEDPQDRNFSKKSTVDDKPIKPAKNQNIYEEEDPFNQKNQENGKH